jgi:hypothetical protein
MPCVPEKQSYLDSYDVDTAIAKSASPDLSEHDIRVQVARSFRIKYRYLEGATQTEDKGEKDYDNGEFVMKDGKMFYPQYGENGIFAEDFHNRQKILSEIRNNPNLYNAQDHQTILVIQQAFAKGASVVSTVFGRDNHDNRDIMEYRIDKTTQTGVIKVHNTAPDGNFHSFSEIKQIAKEKSPTLVEVKTTDNVFILTDIKVDPEVKTVESEKQNNSVELDENRFFSQIANEQMVQKTIDLNRESITQISDESEKFHHSFDKQQKSFLDIKLKSPTEKPIKDVISTLRKVTLNISGEAKITVESFKKYISRRYRSGNPVLSKAILFERFIGRSVSINSEKSEIKIKKHTKIKPEVILRFVANKIEKAYAALPIIKKLNLEKISKTAEKNIRRFERRNMINRLLSQNKDLHFFNGHKENHKIKIKNLHASVIVENKHQETIRKKIKFLGNSFLKNIEKIKQISIKRKRLESVLPPFIKEIKSERKSRPKKKELFRRLRKLSTENKIFILKKILKYISITNENVQSSLVHQKEKINRKNQLNKSELKLNPERKQKVQDHISKPENNFFISSDNKQTEVIRNFSKIFTLYLIFQILQKENQLSNLLQNSNSVKPQKSEAFKIGKEISIKTEVNPIETPYILLAIIWYMTMMREQGIYGQNNNPIIKSTNNHIFKSANSFKKLKTKKRIKKLINFKPGEFPENGLIFVYGT